MGDFNSVLLTGKLVKPTLKDQGAHTFFKMKVQADPTGDAFPVGVSCYVTKKEREEFEKIISRANEGPVNVVVHNGVESGTIRDNDGDTTFMFYDVSAKRSSIEIVEGKVASPTNFCSVKGSVLHAEHDEDRDGTHMIIGSQYFSKDPNNEESKGEWKNRYVRLFIPDELLDTVPEEGTRLIATGKIAEKLGDDWHHHLYAETLTLI